MSGNHNMRGEEPIDYLDTEGNRIGVLESSSATGNFEFRQPGEQVLRVTAEGEFIWHENAQHMIEHGDFSDSPALRFILMKLWTHHLEELNAKEST